MEIFDVDSDEYVEKDERMARRLKRRALSTPNSQFNTLKKKRKLGVNNELGNEIDEDNFNVDFGENPNEDIDPHYKIFLENLRVDGKSYKLEVVSADGRSTFLKYEEECELDDEVEPQAAGRESGDSSDIETIEAQENVSDVSDVEKIETQEKVSDVVGNDKLRTRESRGNIVEKDEREIPKRGFVNGRVGGCYREFFKGEVDESYKAFFCGLQVEGDSYFFVSENGERVNYEDFVDSSSDVEMIEVEGTPKNPVDCVDSSSDVEIIEVKSTPKNPFVTSVAFDSSVVGNPSGSNHSRFREDVMRTLRRPFDSKEREELLRIIKKKKPVGRILDLRSGPRSYHASNSFISYLDHYDDLKRKIREAQFDQWKELTLLRGFFYWLEHLTTEGAFRPWLDSMCLEVLPENR